MRISDWSSDVCSSDLLSRRGFPAWRAERQRNRAAAIAVPARVRPLAVALSAPEFRPRPFHACPARRQGRSYVPALSTPAAGAAPHARPSPLAPVRHIPSTGGRTPRPQDRIWPYWLELHPAVRSEEHTSELQ